MFRELLCSNVVSYIPSVSNPSASLHWCRRQSCMRFQCACEVTLQNTYIGKRITNFRNHRRNNYNKTRVHTVTHQARVTQICFSKLDRHWFSRLMGTEPLSESVLTYRTHKNKFQWNFSQNTKTFIKNNNLKISSAKCWSYCLGRNIFRIYFMC